MKASTCFHEVLLLVVRGLCYQYARGKDLRLDGCVRVEPRRVRFTLVGSFCYLEGGGGFLLNASMILSRRAMPLLNYILAFALKMRKYTKTKNLGYVSRIVLTADRCVDFVFVLGEVSRALLSVSPLGLYPWVTSEGPW